MECVWKCNCAALQGARCELSHPREKCTKQYVDLRWRLSGLRTDASVAWLSPLLHTTNVFFILRIIGWCDRARERERESARKVPNLIPFRIQIENIANDVQWTLTLFYFHSIRMLSLNSRVQLTFVFYSCVSCDKNGSNALGTGTQTHAHTKLHRTLESVDCLILPSVFVREMAHGYEIYEHLAGNTNLELCVSFQTLATDRLRAHLR